MAALSASSRRVPVRRRDIEIADVRVGPEIPDRVDPQIHGARSYLGDGRRVSWSPLRTADTLIAVDAELTHQQVPRSLGHRFGADDPLDFWRRWTTNEVAAKLLDVPILLWLARYGLPFQVRGVTTKTFQIDDVVISCGWCPADIRHTVSGPGALIPIGST